MLKLKVAAMAAATLALTACGTASPTPTLAAGQLTTTSSDSTTSESTTTDPTTSEPTTTEPTTSEPTTTTDSTTVEPTTSTKTPPMEPTKSGVDHRRIALDRVGGGQVTKVERELEHGRTEWKYRILHNGQSYEVRVDAASGRITRFESKK